MENEDVIERLLHSRPKFVQCTIRSAQRVPSQTKARRAQANLMILRLRIRTGAKAAVKTSAPSAA
jgi:hypothetical protein